MDQGTHGVRGGVLAASNVLLALLVGDVVEGDGDNATGNWSMLEMIMSENGPTYR